MEVSLQRVCLYSQLDRDLLVGGDLVLAVCVSPGVWQVHSNG